MSTVGTKYVGKIMLGHRGWRKYYRWCDANTVNALKRPSDNPNPPYSQGLQGCTGSMSPGRRWLGCLTRLLVFAHGIPAATSQTARHAGGASPVP